MNTTKTSGQVPKATGTLVHLDLGTARLLARALDRVGDELGATADRLRVGAAGAGVVALGVPEIVALARWAHGEATGLRRIVARLAALDPGGGPRPAAAFAHPAAAHAAARRVVDDLRAGRWDEARAGLARLAGDVVGATVLLQELGVAGLVDLLVPARARWEDPSPAGAAHRAVVLAVADALALAARAGRAPMTLAEVAVGARARGLAPAAVGLLLTGGARFPTAFLVQALTQVVLPLNRTVLAAPGVSPDPWLVRSPAGPVDVRVAVLAAVGADRRAAVAALAAADLDALLPASLAYLDGGVALARLVRAGTAPVDRFDRPIVGPVTGAGPRPVGRSPANAARVLTWIGRHRSVPLGLQVELGRVARPWVGSLRPAGLDAVVPALLDLDPGRARAFVAYACVREAAARALHDAAWSWAAAEVDRLAGPDAPGGGFDAVGAVLGLVTLGSLDAEAARDATADVTTRRAAQLWQRAGALAASRAPGPLRFVAHRLVRRGLDTALPDADRELEHWRVERGTVVAHEHLALDYLVAAALWRHRRDHPGLGRPPAVLLLDPARPALGLRPPLGLDAAGREAWTAWRSAAAADGPAPLQAAGEGFLLAAGATAPGG